METQQHYHRQRGGFVWPLILIALGVVFLLNNLGILSWSVWDSIWRLWPVILIAIGLDILVGRRSAIGSLIALVLVIAVIAGAVWLVTTATPMVAGQVFTGQTLTTDQVVQGLSGATSADMRIAFGAGSLRIGALKDSGNLIEGTVVTGPGEQVLHDFQMNGDVAHFELRNEGVSFGPLGWHRGDRTWNLDLSSSVPMALNVSTGVGQSMLDLSGLKVTDLHVSSGVGQTEVWLPAQGRVTARISGGVGQLIVTIPEGMAARIHGSAGLGGLSVASRFARQGGGDYVSASYATADDRVDLNISGGVGQVVVR
jgi:LiaI-LiaF-like transmembrane region